MYVVRIRQKALDTTRNGIIVSEMEKRVQQCVLMLWATELERRKWSVFKLAQKNAKHEVRTLPTKLEEK